MFDKPNALGFSVSTLEVRVDLLIISFPSSNSNTNLSLTSVPSFSTVTYSTESVVFITSAIFLIHNWSNRAECANTPPFSYS